MGNQLLLILKAYLNNQSIDLDLNMDEWNELFKMADEHSILPMIYQVVYHCNSLKNLDSDFILQIKNQVIKQVMQQTMKTSQFLQLYKELLNNDLRPLVVKGIICRNIYPEPDYRVSNDEDMLIGDDFNHCHNYFMSHDMYLLDDNVDIHKTYEVPYSKKGTMLYIELHKTFFSTTSEAYGHWNKFFENVQERAIKQTIQGVDIYTLNYTDHLLYLILHAFKHFLHSGVGIRQVCDIIMFANCYGDKIDWKDIYEKLQSIHAEVFAQAIFDIGKKYLVFDETKSCITNEWKNEYVDSQHLLDDILAAGVYGDSSLSRKHSSNMTLEAVSSSKGKRSLKNTLFPSRDLLETRFTYLRRYPILLPIAWLQRLFIYYRETKDSDHNNALEALKIGQERVDLMKEYKIIK